MYSILQLVYIVQNIRIFIDIEVPENNIFQVTMYAVTKISDDTIVPGLLKQELNKVHAKCYSNKLTTITRW